MALTVKKIARLGEGRYHDEHGLYLQVSAKGGRYWAFRYKRKAVEHWLGIGPWPAFSLEEARGRARKATQQLCDGIDPVGLRKAQRDAAAKEEAKRLTFKEAAQQYYDLHQHKWTSEVIKAGRSEIDLDKKVWTVPAGRIKGRREHRVPLVDRAIQILKNLPKEKSDFVFIGARKGTALGQNSMAKLIEDRDDITIHGLPRATYKHADVHPAR